MTSLRTPIKQSHGALQHMNAANPRRRAHGALAGRSQNGGGFIDMKTYIVQLAHLIPVTYGIYYSLNQTYVNGAIRRLKPVPTTDHTICTPGWREAVECVVASIVHSCARGRPILYMADPSKDAPHDTVKYAKAREWLKTAFGADSRSPQDLLNISIRGKCDLDAFVRTIRRARDGGWKFSTFTLDDLVRTSAVQWVRFAMSFYTWLIAMSAIVTTTRVSYRTVRRILHASGWIVRRGAAAKAYLMPTNPGQIARQTSNIASAPPEAGPNSDATKIPRFATSKRDSRAPLNAWHAFCKVARANAATNGHKLTTKQISYMYRIYRRRDRSRVDKLL